MSISKEQYILELVISLRDVSNWVSIDAHMSEDEVEDCTAILDKANALIALHKEFI